MKASDAASAEHIVVATRLHLGRSESPPTDLETKVKSFLGFCRSFNGIPAIAVDAAPKIPGYNLVDAVKLACESTEDNDDDILIQDPLLKAEVIPVMPWQKFVPALNALVGFGAGHPLNPSRILFVSAETTASAEDIMHLSRLVNDEILVAGAALPGHDYQPNNILELNGTTTPWNTLAVWNIRKLAMTGFALVSEGHLSIEPSYGVEEVVAIALLQKLLGTENAQAKLLKLNSVNWTQDFDDPERRRWHDEKMKSKVERADRQLQLMALSGKVHHC